MSPIPLLTCLCLLGQAPTTLALRPQVTVNGPEVRLGEAATLTAPADLAARLAAVSLGSAPVYGTTRVISAGYVRLRLRHAGLDPEGMTITGEFVAVQRAAAGTGAAPTTAPETPALATGEKPVVRRGEGVTVQAICGGVTVTLEGRAGQDAAVGQTITVYLPRTSRTVEARVIAPGQLALEL